jgi:hypothetical protein
MKRAATFIALAALLAVPAAVAAADERFGAELTTEAEEPPNTTPSEGSGSARVTIKDDDSIEYEVSYSNLTGPPAAAHIHYGEPGVAGPVVLPLAHGDSPFSGTLTEADLDPASPITYQQVLDAIRDGGAYVNVHTADNPSGEIRGQLESLPPTSTAAATGGSVPLPALLLVVGVLALIVGMRRFATVSRP